MLILLNLEASGSAYLWGIRRQIDANDVLQRRLEHSTKLLHRAELMAKGDRELQRRLEYPTNLLLQRQRRTEQCIPLLLFHHLIGGNSRPASYAVYHPAHILQITRMARVLSPSLASPPPGQDYTLKGIFNLTFLKHTRK
jgi:hypothetical protein